MSHLGRREDAPDVFSMSSSEDETHVKLIIINIIICL